MDLRGHLLVASPYLGDSSFAGTVVLMVYHSPDGAFGLVLNRPFEGPVQTLWDEVHAAAQADHSGIPAAGQINFGGPVSGPLMALHPIAALGDVEVPSGIYLAAERTQLEKLLRSKAPYKLFIGHAGWGQGQLERELRQGAWLVTRATPDHVFGSNENLWQRLVREIGWHTLQAALNIKHVPPDPTWN